MRLGTDLELVRPETSSDDALLERMRRDLHDRFGIEHSTFQIEVGNPAHPCPLAPPQVV